MKILKKISDLTSSACSLAELETLQKPLVLRKFLNSPYRLYVSFKEFTAGLRISLISSKILNIRNNKAFTLVEMVVAIAIFTVFVSMLAGTYLYVARAQRDTAELRKIYSGQRDVVEAIGEDVMNYSVFYDCYEGEAPMIAECPTSSDLTHGGVVSVLGLTDGDEGLVYYEEDGAVYLAKYDYEEGGWTLADGFEEGGVLISGADLTVENLYFGIYPYVDPVENYSDVEVQFQPYVTIYLDEVQTSVSTRSYE